MSSAHPVFSILQASLLRFHFLSECSLSLMHGTKLFFHCVFQFFRGLIYRKYLSLFSCNIIRNFRECFRECSIMDCCFMFVYNIDNPKGMKCNQTNFVFADSVVVMNMKQADSAPSSIKPQVFSSKLKKIQLFIYILFLCIFILFISFIIKTFCLSFSPDVEEVENLLLYNLPSLCYCLSDWPALLCEAPGPQLCVYKGTRATQFCLLIILHLAHQQGDR